MRTLGVNRASLGVQDVNPLVQAAIGRWQPMQDVEVGRGALACRRHSQPEFRPDLRTAAADHRLAPQDLRDRGDIVAGSHRLLRLRPHATSEGQPAAYRRDTLPGIEERIDQAEIIAEEFLRQGFRKIGIDHFAKPDDALARAATSGRLHRNFQGYTDDGRETLIGLGASSISRFPDGYVQNISDVPGYVRAISAGRLAPSRGYRLDAAEQRARTIESLMCQFQADLDVTAPDMAFDEEFALLQPLVRDGLVQIEDRVVKATEAGRSVVRVIAAVFDPHTRADTARFSKAV